LYPDLSNPQKPGSTLEGANCLAACHISAGHWKNQYIAKRACSGGCAKEDEVW
jgi:hypothetical protein